MKKNLTIFLMLLISIPVFSQNITNTIGANGSYIIKDATNTFFTLLQSTGNVGIGTNSFDPVNPEKLLIDCGTTNSVNAIYAKGTINSYMQLNLRNLSNGNQASSDLVTTANNGTETTNFMDIGINGSGYVYQSGNPIETGKTNDCYILGAGNDLYIVNNNAAKDMLFLTGGTATANERMRIKYNGNVGIGYSDPGTYKLKINGNCYATQFYIPSDIRLKNDVQSLQNTLEKILKLRGVSFKYNNDITGKMQIGFIAQEMEKLFPELVITNDDGYKGISYPNMTAVLLEGIKEQQGMIDLQNKKIDNLETRLLALEQKSGVLNTNSAGINSPGLNINNWVLISILAGAVTVIFINRRSFFISGLNKK